MTATVTDTPEQELLSPNSWIWNSQPVPPLSGQVRTNSRDWVGATQLHIDRRNEAGTDLSTDLAAIKANDQIRFEHQTDAGRYARYLVSAPATLATDAYVFPVSYMTGGGVLPNSGTRIVLSLLAAVPGTTVSWSITYAREPNRYWVTCACLHGRLAETVATSGGRPLIAQSVVPTTSQNLRRKFGCTCDAFQPALPA